MKMLLRKGETKGSAERARSCLKTGLPGMELQEKGREMQILQTVCSHWQATANY